MLKSLEIFGFKSFADRIRFDFASGITGVVGPNGSGKSNVVDAMKWILGDQSAKSLRGKEMTDVIFNGASGRKPSAFAEATLTFDNRTGFLPIAATEVQIGRRINRSGEAEYLINRATARLKDVRDLFMGTGAGSSSYCIIEQGRVDQILHANAATRRMVFEEAAGISRFRARKNDAERKLERVDQNLARLTDIVDEVEAQLNAIRSQAVKAAKFRQVSEQLRAWWLGFAADQYRHHSGRMTHIQAALLADQEVLDSLIAHLSEIETSLSEIDATIGEADERLRDVERQGAAHREESARHEATVRHQSARLREMDADVVRLRRQRAIVEERCGRADAEVAAVVEQCAQFERDYQQLEQELAKQSRRTDEMAASVEICRTDLESQRQQLLETLRQLNETTHRATVLNSQTEQQRALIMANGQRQRALEQRFAELVKHRELDRQKVQEAANRVASLGETFQARERERLVMAGLQEEFHLRLAERREQRSAWRARKNVLEDLESRQEGLGIGVKDILHRARTARFAPWDEVLGSVAELLEVDLEQAALVEIALGSRAQAIVLNDVRPLLRYLNRSPSQIVGRVEFIARRGGASNVRLLTEDTEAVGPFLQPTTLDPAALPNLNGHPGVQCRADNLVRPAEAVPELGTQLLCDTWIVDTLDAALQLAAAAGRGCRFVTLQGELVDAAGTLSVGALRGETTLVSQKSELRRLRNDLLRIDRQIDDDERQLETVAAQLTEVDDHLEHIKVQLREASEGHAHYKVELADSERQLSRLESERAAIDSETAEQNEQLNVGLSRLEDVQLEFAVLEGDIQGARAQIAAMETELVAGEMRLSQSKSRDNEGRLELAKREERLASLRESQRRLQGDKLQFEQQAEEARRRLQHVSVDRQRVALHILNTNALLAECLLKAEAHARAAASIRAHKELLRGRRADCLREESRLREERRHVNDRLHEAQIQSREMRHEIESLAQRIEEEYQVTLADVVASGASAVKLHAREERSSRAGKRDTAGDDASPEMTDLLPIEGEDLDEPMTDEKFGEAREAIEARINRLRRQLKLMGSVNTESLRDLDDLERRFAHLSDQLADLVEAKKALEEILRRINAESRRLFTESFQSIHGHFQELFRKLFGGGEGTIILEDPQNILECGIDVVARPPGKELRSISLLSGGEKTLTAVALLLAIFKSRPSPFCILDEVDAALDEANVERFANVLREFKQTTQFIMITHSKRSMAAADVLYGITMEESGISKRLAVRFEEVGENGEIRGGNPAPATPRRGRDAA
jgi:chromosome segregation protein